MNDCMTHGINLFRYTTSMRTRLRIFFIIKVTTVINDSNFKPTGHLNISWKIFQAYTKIYVHLEVYSACIRAQSIQQRGFTEQ